MTDNVAITDALNRLEKVVRDEPDFRCQECGAHTADIETLLVALKSQWEYTYMHPVNGYEDDYAGLPGELGRAEEVAALFPGKGKVLRRVASGPWVPVEQDGA